MDFKRLENDAKCSPDSAFKQAIDLDTTHLH